MALEVMKSIRDVEDRAEEMYRKALEEAREISRETDQTIQDMEEQLAETCARDKEARLLDAQREAEEEIAKMLRDNQVLCQELEEQASRNLPRATDFLVERIVSSLDR